MRRCAFAYCRAPMGDVPVCPRCGHPADPARLRDPAFFLESCASIEGLPAHVLDMHQILPAYPGIARILLAAMDRLHVDRALLQSAPDAARSLSGNAAILEAARASAGRFVATWFVDPRQPDALAELDRMVASGVRVAKLIPVFGWSPDDDAFSPFFERMEALGLVAMTHTGFFTARHKAEEAAAGIFASSTLADPLRWDRVLRRCPTLTLILCHCGGSVHFEAAAELIAQHETAWGDVAASGVFALQRFVAQGIPVEWSKILWGNDGPPYAYPFNLRLLLDAIRDVGDDSLAAALLHDNGARFAARYLG